MRYPSLALVGAADEETIRLAEIVASVTQLLGTESGALYCLQADQKPLAVQTTRGLPATSLAL